MKILVIITLLAQVMHVSSSYCMVMVLISKYLLECQCYYFICTYHVMMVTKLFRAGPSIEVVVRPKVGTVNYWDREKCIVAFSAA